MKFDRKGNNDLLSGILSILSPGEAMSKLGVSKLVQAAWCRHAEVAPHILVAAEVELRDGSSAGLESLWKDKRDTDRGVTVWLHVQMPFMVQFLCFYV